MKRFFLVTLLLFVALSGSFAQYYTPQNKVWAFGYGAGLDFTSGTPVSIGTSINSFEACASVADGSGSLLFYTDGKTVYDRTGAIMPSGASVVSYGVNSATQGALIAPVSGSTTQYYVFSLEEIGGSTGSSHLSYSIVDMTLAGGLGDVVAASMGTSITNKLTEKMVAVAGTHCDLWVIVHRVDSNNFLAYNVSSAGVTGPVISRIGTMTGSNVYTVGSLKASPNGRKLVSQAAFSGGTELFDFDPSTGILSNCQVLNHTNAVYGCEFSPDNTKLYSYVWVGAVDQYDITGSTTAAIIATRTTVIASAVYSDLRLAPDGKIYVNEGSGTLGCITNPNASGSACGYTTSAVSISSGTASYQFPNIYVSFGGGDTTFMRKDTVACIPSGGSIILTAHATGATSTSYVWNDGVTTAAHTTTAIGTYWVLIDTGGCHKEIDTFVITTPTPTITSHVHDTAVCALYFPIGLTATAGFTTYHWSSGATTTTPTSTAPTSGTYWAWAADNCGNITADTFHVNYIAPDTTIGTSTTFAPCIATAPLTLTATSGFTSYRWNTGSFTSTTNVSTSGTYWVYKRINCSVVVDTFHVNFIPIPTLNLGPDVAFCIGDSIVLSSAQPSGTTYTWSTGSTGDSIHVTTSGTYWLRLYNGCTITDSIHVLVSPYPVVDLGPDTFNCTGAPVTLASLYTYTAPTYTWSNGTGAATMSATSTGDYWLKVNVAGCSSTDTIHVTIQFDTFRLENRDTAICKGKVVQAVLHANPAATFQWLPTAGIGVSNVASPLITPDTSSRYTVNIFITGCPTLSTSFMIDVQPNPTVYVGGNRFVCEFDTIHINSSVAPSWYAGYTYSWSPTTSLDFSNTPTVVFTAGVSQKYILTVSTSAGCVGKDSAQLIVQPGNFGGITPDFSVCPRDSALIAGTGGVSYHWYPSLYLSDSLSATPWVRPIGTMHYKLIVTSAVGCHDTLSVNVGVHPGALLSLDDSVTLYPGETVQLSPTTNCSSFVWFPLAGLNSNTVSNPVASPDVDTKYFVHGVTSDGCMATDSISVHISSESLLTLPNAFAPGNGINKTFSVIKRGEATLNYFRIFNRWGNVVFETKDISQGWDGTYNGAPQPLGVYVYDVQAVSNSGKIFNKRGNVTLLR